MEIQINKEIKDYKETFAMGLTLRQITFSILTLGAALIAYKLSIDHFGLEITSWICMASAAPFALLGFLKYEGMFATEFVKVWIRYQLTPKKIQYQAENLFYEQFKDLSKKLQKEEKQNKKEPKTAEPYKEDLT